MTEFRFTTSDDVLIFEQMYQEEIENHPERARKFAEDLVLKYKTILAFKDNELCGTVSWDPRSGLDDGVVEMIGLGVKEHFKRQGIATNLVNLMIEKASKFYSEQGYNLRVILLFMERGNEIARKFYSANRFKETSVIPSLYPHGDASIWTRHL
jgi:ribosomal protein S18 acetylase RimI-like enzyme